MTQTAPRPESDNGSASKKPVDKFREGPVHVSIWENDGIKGAFRSASFELRYKKQDEWQTSHSYGASDLKHLENAAREAHYRIETWQQQNKGRQVSGRAADRCAVASFFSPPLEVVYPERPGDSSTA